LFPSSPGGNRIEGDGDTILSIEDLTIAFDGTAARRSLEDITDEEIQRRRDVWLHQQQQDCD
jgi:hypothetical protein